MSLIINEHQIGIMQDMEFSGFVEQYNDIFKKAIGNLQSDNLRIFFLCNIEKTIAKVVLHEIGNNNEMGYFQMYCANGIGSGEPIFLTIEVDDNLRSKGYANLMIGFLIYMLRINIGQFNKNGIGLSDLSILGIDADASGGFWDKIKLMDGRYTWDLSVPRRQGLTERHFEKSTTLGQLSHEILKNNSTTRSKHKTVKTKSSRPGKLKRRIKSKKRTKTL